MRENILHKKAHVLTHLTLNHSACLFYDSSYFINYKNVVVARKIYIMTIASIPIKKEWSGSGLTH